jgi:hypothetical protein
MRDFWNKKFVPFDSLTTSGGAGIAVIAPYDNNKLNTAAAYCFKREFDKYGQERERYDDISDNLFKFLLKKTNQCRPIARDAATLECGFS